MESSPKGKRGPSETALQILEWQLAYNVLDWLQAPLSFVFWLMEHRKAWLVDPLTSKGGAQ